MERLETLARRAIVSAHPRFADGRAVVPVTPAMRRFVAAYCRALDRSPVRLRALTAGVNDPDRNRTGKLGEIAAAAACRALGFDVDISPLLDLGGRPVFLDLCLRVSGLAIPVEVKTAKRREFAGPSYTCHVNGRRLVADMLYLFASYARIPDAVEVLGWADAETIATRGAFAPRGVAFPWDRPTYGQRAPNWGIRCLDLYPLSALGEALA